MNSGGRGSRVSIDAVLAVRNEEENIPLITSAIRSQAMPENVDLRMIFVEDGSTDATLEQLRTASRTHRDIRYYSISNPHGQTAAIAFGMSKSQADALIMMDGDGGHPPNLMPEMITAYLQGCDVVQGVRTQAEGRDAHRNAATALFQIVVHAVTRFDATRQNVFFRLVSRRIAARILRDYKCLYFLRLTFLDDKDVRTGYVAFESPKRLRGQSKYTLKRLVTFSFYGLLSVLSVPRFLLLICLAVLPAVIAAMNGFVLVGAVLAVVPVAGAIRYFRLCTHNVLSGISVVEEG